MDQRADGQQGGVLRAHRRDLRSVQVIVALMTALTTGLLLAAGSFRVASGGATTPSDRQTLVIVLVIAVAVGLAGSCVVVGSFVSTFGRWLRRGVLGDSWEQHPEWVRTMLARLAVETGATGAVVGAALGVALGFAISPTVQSALPPVEQGYHPLDSPSILVPFVVVLGAVVLSFAAALASVSRSIRAARAARGELATLPGRVPLTAGRWFLGLLLTATGIAAAVLAARSGVTADERTPVVLTGLAITFLGLTALGPALATGVLRVLGAPFAWTRTGGFALRHALRSPARTAQLMLVLTAGVALITLSTVVVDGVDASLGVAAAVVAAAIALALTISRTIDERSYEIRVLRRVGASARQVRSMLLAEGALVGFAGTVIGVVLALGFATAISGVDGLDVPAALLPVLAVLGPACGAWATLRPAVHAERQPRLDSLRAG